SLRDSAARFLHVGARQCRDVRGGEPTNVTSPKLLDLRFGRSPTTDLRQVAVRLLRQGRISRCFGKDRTGEGVGGGGELAVGSDLVVESAKDLRYRLLYRQRRHLDTDLRYVVPIQHRLHTAGVVASKVEGLKEV